MELPYFGHKALLKIVKIYLKILNKIKPLVYFMQDGGQFFADYTIEEKN